MILPGEEKSRSFGKRVKAMEKLPLGAVLRTPTLTAQDLQPNVPHRFGRVVGAEDFNVLEAHGKQRACTFEPKRQLEEERIRQRQLQERSRSRIRAMGLYQDDHVMFINKPSGLPVQVSIAITFRLTSLDLVFWAVDFPYCEA